MLLFGILPAFFPWSPPPSIILEPAALSGLTCPSSALASLHHLPSPRPRCFLNFGTVSVASRRVMSAFAASASGLVFH